MPFGDHQVPLPVAPGTYEVQDAVHEQVTCSGWEVAFVLAMVSVDGAMSCDRVNFEVNCRNSDPNTGYLPSAFSMVSLL